MASSVDTLDNAIAALVVETRELVRSTQHESRLERDRPVFQTRAAAASDGSTTPLLAAYDRREALFAEFKAAHARAERLADRLAALDAKTKQVKAARDADPERFRDIAMADGGTRAQAIVDLFDLRDRAAVELRDGLDQRQRLGEKYDAAHNRYQVALRATP